MAGINFKPLKIKLTLIEKLTLTKAIAVSTAYEAADASVELTEQKCPTEDPEPKVQARPLPVALRDCPVESI